MADSIREALTSAFTKAEEDEKSTPAATPAPEPVKVDTATAAPVGEGKPSDKPPERSEPVKSTSSDRSQPVKPVTSVQPDLSKPVEPLIPVVGEKAPASWRAEEKAAWGTVPPAARAAIMRRESETQRVLSVSADARRTADQFSQLINPFIPLMEHHGVQPMQAINTLLQTRAALEIGTPDQKAQLVANLIHQFGIDIEKLDNQLVSGKGVNIDPQPARIDPRSIPEFAPLFSLADQVRASQTAKVDAQFEEIEVLPHYEALREDMADIMESFAHRGKVISLKQAYHIAASSDPQYVGSVAPQQVTSVSDAAAILSRSRNAASSVAGAPKTSPSSKPTDRRSQIEAAFNAAGA